MTGLVLVIEALSLISSALLVAGLITGALVAATLLKVEPREARVQAVAKGT